jgi:cell wall-associated NlpC family hydrolase
LMQLKKTALLGVSVLFFAPVLFAQEVRPRVAPNAAQIQDSAIISAPPATIQKTVILRPVNQPKSVLTNEIAVRSTAEVRAVNASAAANASAVSLAAFRARMMTAMYSKLGKPYIWGASGPNAFDCSGLVWSVFSEAGITMERTSAATMWRTFEPATGEDRYKFGTLVFFNKLGHVGIVIDQDTFYQASSSKGVTISNFAGYWEKRIVGFRHVPLN